MAKKKKIFRVYAKVVTYSYLDVEADDKDEAEEIAENTDGGDFIADDETTKGDFVVAPEELPTKELK